MLKQSRINRAALGSKLAHVIYEFNKHTPITEVEIMDVLHELMRQSLKHLLKAEMEEEE